MVLIKIISQTFANINKHCLVGHMVIVIFEHLGLFEFSI